MEKATSPLIPDLSAPCKGSKHSSGCGSGYGGIHDYRSTPRPHLKHGLVHILWQMVRRRILHRRFSFYPEVLHSHSQAIIPRSQIHLRLPTQQHITATWHTTPLSSVRPDHVRAKMMQGTHRGLLSGHEVHALTFPDEPQMSASRSQNQQSWLQVSHARLAQSVGKARPYTPEGLIGRAWLF